eukprot:superscaffoldBa00000411_g4530
MSEVGLNGINKPAHWNGPDEKKVKSKKEKMKERRERWLNKISSIKQAKERQAAEARRQATPVVGDMKPLADALPELSELITPAATAPAARRKSRKNKVPVKRPEPTDFSQMKQSQKRKLLETETSRFSDAVKTLSAKMNPLADIGEQLRKRMKQEEEQGSSWFWFISSVHSTTIVFSRSEPCTERSGVQTLQDHLHQTGRLALAQTSHTI